MTYYTAITILVWLSLIILSILVAENNRLPNKKKLILYFTYAIVALAATAEWIGVQLNGNENIPAGLLKAVKFFDYILTPVAGGIIVLQFRSKSIWQKIILGLVAVNFLFQLVCVFTNWMIVIDEHNVYSHGILYYAYIAIYLLIVILVIIEFAMHGRTFKKRNLVSLYAVLLFVIAGIVLQEFFKDVRTAYLALVLGLALLFIHDSEFSQLKADETIQEQTIQITIDPLTNISNRFAYEKALQEIEMKDDFVVFSIDINGLKKTNDTLGHRAGDELICGAATTIDNTFKAFGGVSYRTGGDEFIVLANLDENKIKEAMKALEENTEKWKGVEVKSLSLSAGYASIKESPELDVHRLIYIADQRMYKIKSDYYLKNGNDRREH